MGAKDLAEKNLLQYKDVFSDIVNVNLFGGRCYVSEEELSREPGELITKAVSGKNLRQLQMDVPRKCSIRPQSRRVRLRLASRHLRSVAILSRNGCRILQQPLRKIQIFMRYMRQAALIMEERPVRVPAPVPEQAPVREAIITTELLPRCIL